MDVVWKRPTRRTAHVAKQRTIAARHEWEDVLRVYDVHTALIGSDSSLASAMSRSDRWQVLYEDEQAVIYAAD